MKALFYTGLLLLVLVTASCATNTTAPDTTMTEPVVDDAPSETTIEEPTTKETIVGEPESVVEETLTEGPAAEWLATFRSKAKRHSYTIIDDNLGKVRVVVNEDRVEYRPVDYFFRVDDGVISKSTRTLETEYDEELAKEVLLKEEPLIHYAWRGADGTLKGCYISSNSAFAYDEEECIRYESDDTVQLIHEDLSFATELKLAYAWLVEYKNAQPEHLEKGLNHEDDLSDRDYVVTKAFYDNDDGTTTILYIENFFKVPMQVDIEQTKNHNLIKRYEYGGFTLG